MSNATLLQVSVTLLCLPFVLALWLLALALVLRLALPSILTCVKSLRELLDHLHAHRLAEMDRELERERIRYARA